MNQDNWTFKAKLTKGKMVFSATYAKKDTDVTEDDTLRRIADDCARTGWGIKEVTKE